MAAVSDDQVRESPELSRSSARWDYCKLQYLPRPLDFAKVEGMDQPLAWPQFVSGTDATNVIRLRQARP
jgi:hypothetical protein